MGTHPIFESDFDCLTGIKSVRTWQVTIKRRISKRNKSKFTKFESPSPVRTVVQSNESQMNSLRLPKTSSRKSRDPCVCQPKHCELPPVRRHVVKDPKPGIVSKCAFTSVLSIFSHQPRLFVKSLNSRSIPALTSKSPFAIKKSDLCFAPFEKIVLFRTVKKVYFSA